MADVQNEKDKIPRGNDKPGGGSQVPSRQQGRNIIPGDDSDADIEKEEKPEK